MEEDNRETLRLLRESGTAEKLEGLKRLIAQSAWATNLGVQAVSWGSLGQVTESTNLSLPCTRPPPPSVCRT